MESKTKNSLQRKVAIFTFIVIALTCFVLVLTVNIFQNFLSGIIASILLVILSQVIICWGVSKITKPIIILKDRVVKMVEEGDYSSPMPEFGGDDELQELSIALKMLQKEQLDQIHEMSNVLSKIADNDFNIEITRECKGDLLVQKKAMQALITKLNLLVYKVDKGMTGIFQSTQTVASVIQTVSNGSISQLEAIEEVTESMQHVYEDTRRNAKAAIDSTDIANAAGKVMVSSHAQMKDLMDAMEEISTTSQKISKVIKTVDDIAFQTNILALNASVEAARAGVAGKGFAVVADEVRSLANRSAEASKGTAGLIEGAIRAINIGSKIAQDTTNAFDEVMNRAKESTELTAGMSSAIQEQERQLKSITAHMNRITEIVNTNSSIAQEGAASSQELFGQTQILKETVSQYNLRPQHAQY